MKYNTTDSLHKRDAFLTLLTEERYIQKHEFLRSTGSPIFTILFKRKKKGTEIGYIEDYKIEESLSGNNLKF